MKKLLSTSAILLSATVLVACSNNQSDSSEPHDTIMILLTGTAKDSAKETMDAINSNSATTNQQNAITVFRMSISEFAKKLPDDNTTLSLGYEKSADQYDLIAKSSKQKDFIPVGEIIVN